MFGREEWRKHPIKTTSFVALVGKKSNHRIATCFVRAKETLHSYTGEEQRSVFRTSHSLQDFPNIQDVYIVFV